MDWTTAAGLTLGILFLYYVFFRAERRVFWAIMLLVVLPTAVGIGVWATWRGRWLETVIGGAAATVIAVAWWFRLGQRMPRGTSDSIRVWGQDSPPRSKSQENAALQAEVARLREERSRLEAEVRRLEGGNGSSPGGKPSGS